MMAWCSIGPLGPPLSLSGYRPFRHFSLHSILGTGSFHLREPALALLNYFCSSNRAAYCILLTTCSAYYPGLPAQAQYFPEWVEPSHHPQRGYRHASEQPTLIQVKEQPSQPLSHVSSPLLNSSQVLCLYNPLELPYHRFLLSWAVGKLLQIRSLLQRRNLLDIRSLQCTDEETGFQ